MTYIPDATPKMIEVMKAGIGNGRLLGEVTDEQIEEIANNTLSELITLIEEEVNKYNDDRRENLRDKGIV